MKGKGRGKRERVRERGREKKGDKKREGERPLNSDGHCELSLPGTSQAHLYGCY